MVFLCSLIGYTLCTFCAFGSNLSKRSFNLSAEGEAVGTEDFFEVNGSDECFVETGEGRPVEGAFVATAEEGRFSSLW